MAEPQNPSAKEMVQDEIRAEVVEECYNKMVSMYNKVDQDQVGSMWNPTKSPGQSSGEPNHSTLSFSSSHFTMFS